MQIVIELSDEEYKDIMFDKEHSPRNLDHYERLIVNAVVLPKGHGRLIDADKALIKLTKMRDDGFLIDEKDKLCVRFGIELLKGELTVLKAEENKCAE